MLRSDAEVALDQATESCKRSADHYRAARDAAHDADLKGLFRRLEEKRRRQAAALEEAVRAMGNLPSAPDADREAIDHLLTRARAVFSPDERLALLQKTEKVEEEFRHDLSAALDQDLPSPVRELIRGMVETVSEDLGRLSRERQPGVS